MNLKKCIMLLLLVSPLFCTCCKQRTLADELQGMRIFYNSGFAGEELEFCEAAGRYRVIRRVLGSGVAVVSECKYEVASTGVNFVELGDIVEGDRSMFPRSQKIRIERKLNTLRIFYDDHEKEIWFVRHLRGELR